MSSQVSSQVLQLTLQAEHEHPCDPEFRVVKLHHDSQRGPNFQRRAPTLKKSQLHLQVLWRQVPAFTRRTAVTLFPFYAPRNAKFKKIIYLSRGELENPEYSSLLRVFLSPFLLFLSEPLFIPRLFSFVDLCSHYQINHAGLSAVDGNDLETGDKVTFSPSTWRVYQTRLVALHGSPFVPPQLSEPE